MKHDPRQPIPTDTAPDPRLAAPPPRSLWVLAVAVTVLASVLLLLVVQKFPSPGTSAQLLASHVRGHVFMPLTHGLWGWLARLVDQTAPSQVAVFMNVFSAVCAAICLGLVAWLTAGLAHVRSQEERMSRGSLARAGQISGVCAALALLAAPSFWVVATRAHVAPLEFLLLLVPFVLIGPAMQRRPALAVLACLIWAIGITQYSTIIALTPIFGGTLLWRLWRAGRLGARLIVACVLVGVLGLLLYVVQAWLFTHTPAYFYRDFKSVWAVLDIVVREQYATLVHAMPKVGWLVIGLVSVLPWTLVVMTRHAEGRQMNQQSLFGSVVLNLVLTALCVHVLSQGLLSPWKVGGGAATLLVFPYLLIAVWTGYLAGYWYLVLAGRRYGRPNRLGPLLSVGFVVLFVGFLGYRVYDNWARLHPSAGAPVAQLAARVVKDAQAKDWVFLATPVDDDVLLAATDRDLAGKLVSVRRARHLSYRRFLADQLKTPRLSSMAMIGIEPLLSEWAALDPVAVQRFGFVGTSDLLVQGGLEPLPEGSLIVPRQTGSMAQLDKASADTLDFAAQWEHLRSTYPADQGTLQGTRDWAENYVSRQVNNLGVQLEDAGRTNEAEACYARASAIDPLNLSAVLNQLARRSLATQEVERLNKLVSAIMARPDGQARLWNLSRFGGYVRAPELYIQRGWAWAGSGRPRAAVADLRRALTLSGGNDMVKLHLAEMLAGQDQSVESEAYYQQVLSRQPTNRVALRGLSRTSMLRGEFDSARQYVTRLGELGESKTMVTAEEALIDYLDGKREQALERMKLMIKEQEPNPGLLALTAFMAQELGNQELVMQSLGRLEKVRKLDPSLRLTMARLQSANGHFREALELLELVLRQQATNEKALELVVRIHFAQRSRDQVERYLERLLAVNPKSGIGNYILGTLHAFREQYLLAEAAFRTAAPALETPEVYADLAWALARQGRLEEALAPAQRSLQMNPKNGTAWAVTGEVMLSQDKLEDALRAFDSALAIRPDTAAYKVGLFRVYQRQGLRQQALTLGEDLLRRPGELPGSLYEEMREMVHKLREQV